MTGRDLPPSAITSYGGIWIALALTSTATATANAAPTRYEVDDREPMALVVSTPTGRRALVRSSELIRQIDAALRADTSLAVQTLPSELVKACRGKLGCLALKARSDYDPDGLRDRAGRKLPYREHVRRLKDRGVEYPRYLLVVSNVTLPGRLDRLSAVLVDTDVALQLFHDADRDHPEWADRFEARVDAGAVAGDAATGEVRDADEVRAFFTRFFGVSVRRRLNDTGHWRPYGLVRIETSVPNAAIIWDGRTVGATIRGTTELAQAQAGQHILAIEHPRYLTVTRGVQVTAGATSLVRLDPRIRPDAEPVGRKVLFWSGVGLAAVGGAVGLYALARQDRDAVSVCVGGDCPSGSRFQTAGYDPDADVAGPINPPGVLLGPLGYSLAATGAAWSVGTLLTDEGDFPWWPLVIGLAAGGLSYGLSAALDGP